MNKTNNLDKQTIPKIIYFCWFGNNPKPELFWKCFHSWKKYCPDYKIIEWNEKNFDLRSCLYAQEAYDAKKICVCYRLCKIMDHLQLWRCLFRHGC
ncbi:capsular polysaccharide synthesis protein [Coprococcus catus]